MHAEKGNGSCGIIACRKLIHEVVAATSGEKLCAVVEAGGVRGIHDLRRGVWRGIVCGVWF